MCQSSSSSLPPNFIFLDLPTNQLEWGVADPMSSVAQLNYRRGKVHSFPSVNVVLTFVYPGVYGRLSGNSVFPTTVTNVDPTAKQSQVLHPFVRYFFVSSGKF